ncbi:hypothetical protein BDC45DRAFT_513492 [Circinella umbellata]|nr:hypothetical protein BDC45DRAFT_513492 [Circinella umbellata]
MSSILKQSEEDPSTQKEVVERAKWFYYTKFFKSFDLEAFREWNNNKDNSKTEETKNITETTQETDAKEPADTDSKENKDGEDDKPQRFTFQELVEMIESGKEIPGIRQIPNKINEGTPSEPKLSIRQKPWETSTPATTTETTASTSP